MDSCQLLLFIWHIQLFSFIEVSQLKKDCVKLREIAFSVLFLYLDHQIQGLGGQWVQYLKILASIPAFLLENASFVSILSLYPLLY